MSGLLKAVARKLAKYLCTLDLLESRRSDWEERGGVYESAGDHIFLYKKGIEISDGWVFFMYIRVLC